MGGTGVNPLLTCPGLTRGGGGGDNVRGSGLAWIEIAERGWGVQKRERERGGTKKKEKKREGEM